MQIDQAIFTSARTSQSEGYQLVASSPGVTTAEAAELATWCPSHDALWSGEADAASINFHPLGTGRHTISKSFFAGSEYSCRAGRLVYTRCLVVSTEVLKQFANNPMALLNAAIAEGAMDVLEHVAKNLQPFEVVGRAARFDQRSLLTLARRPLGQWVAAIIDALSDDQPLGIMAGERGRQVVCALLNCLPVECRPEVSFTTGLKHSPRRSFRLINLAADSIDSRRLERAFGLRIFDLSEDPPELTEGASNWARFVSQALAEGDLATLRNEIGRTRPELRLADLEQLVVAPVRHRVFVKRITAHDSAAPNVSQTSVDVQHGGDAATKADRAPEDAAEQEFDRLASISIPFDRLAEAQIARRADAAHARFIEQLDAIRKGLPNELADDMPSQALAADRPDWLAMLELLDDVVFDAIAGKQVAFEQLQTLWPEVLSALGPGRVDESKEQYIRHALSVWKHCRQDDLLGNTARSTRALDVLCLLIGE